MKPAGLTPAGGGYSKASTGPVSSKVTPTTGQLVSSDAEVGEVVCARTLCVCGGGVFIDANDLLALYAARLQLPAHVYPLRGMISAVDCR
jgi:hypothetical protein